MMDGISAMDTGNNGQMIAMNIESIAEVKVLTQGYQAEYGRSSGLQITAVTKSGTNRFRGSAYDLITNSDWNTIRQLTKSERRSETGGGLEDPRLLHRRSGRQAGRHQQAVLLLQPRVPPDATTRSTAATRFACACRRRPSARGTSRRPSIRTARSSTYIKDPTLSGGCSATEPDGCFADGGVIGKIPANRLYSAWGSPS